MESGTADTFPIVVPQGASVLPTRLAPVRRLRSRPGRSLAAAACSLSLVAVALGHEALGAGPAAGADAAAAPADLRVSLGAATGAERGAARETGSRDAAERPNVVMITTDDMSADELAHLPNVQRLLVDRGATFSSAIAPTPLCVPARASLLTGQYAHNHGARSTEGPHGGVTALDERETLPVWLQRAGYDTLFLGKYVNGYGFPATKGHGPRSVPPGWDSWQATVGHSTYRYTTPRVNHDGRLKLYHRYTTDLFGDFAARQAGKPERRTTPWFMWLSFVAPHSGPPRDPEDPLGLTKSPSPSERDRGDFRGSTIPIKPSLWQMTRGSQLPRKDDTPRWRAAMQQLHAERLEALQSVDRAVGRLGRTLRRTGQLDDTVIVFSSDNGYSKGYHLKDGKVLPWQESLQIPLVIAGPGIPHRTVRTTVANPDIATTVAAIAGAEPRVPQDGIDVRPLLEGPARDRALPIAAWQLADGRIPIYRGVRTDRWTYLRLENGSEEVYDRQEDPYELVNVAGSEEYAATLGRLRALDEEVGSCRGETCPGVSDQEPFALVAGPD